MTCFDICSLRRFLPMSALGQKQTSRLVRAMSALPPKADIGTQPRDVRFVPKADISRCGRPALFDHLVRERKPFLANFGNLVFRQTWTVSAASCSVRLRKNASLLITSAPARIWTKDAKTAHRADVRASRIKESWLACPQSSLRCRLNAASRRRGRSTN